MKCPLLAAKRGTVGEMECQGEDCALWNKRYGCCDEVAKTEILGLIHEDLYAISVKETKGGKPRDDDIIEDGFGSAWSAWCPECGEKTMSVVRPGKVQCDNCG